MAKTALVTGASGGIGMELAQLLAAENYHLILADYRERELTDVAKRLKRAFPELDIDAIAMDLAAPGAAQALFQKAGKPVHVLINNAGFGVVGHFKDTDWERENRMIHLHVLTLTELCKLFGREMAAAGSGRIMNVASVAGFQPSPLMAVYNATKAYVLSFSEAIANELKGTGVTVTVLCPGLTITGFQEAVGVGSPKMTANRLISAGAREVAQYGLKAMMKGKTIAIPGLLNRIFATLHRVLPRNTVTSLVRKAQERNRRFLKDG